MTYQPDAMKSMSATGKMCVNYVKPFDSGIEAMEWIGDERFCYLFGRPKGIDFIRDGHVGRGSKRSGDASWLRLTERWTATAKSVFLFDVQGAVAKSTFAGLPWLMFLRSECKRPIHFWPFDGWEIPSGTSAIVEVYPSLWMRRFPKEGRDGDEQAAYAVAAWLQGADRSGSLSSYFKPPLTPEEREVARIEGWILGVA